MKGGCFVPEGQVKIAQRFNVVSTLGPEGGGTESTAVELSLLRRTWSAEFIPLPADLHVPRGGGLKSALLNSTAMLPDPPPVTSRGEREKLAEYAKQIRRPCHHRVQRRKPCSELNSALLARSFNRVR